MAQSEVSASSWSPTYSPSYKSEPDRAPASTAPGGCGLVKALTDDQQPPSAGQMGQMLTITAMMLVPLLVALRLRRKSSETSRIHRRYERFSIAKNVMIQIGDQVVSTASQTLAVGGLSFKSELTDVFTKGQKIKLKISDVAEEVEGEIVWSAESNSFGVRFLNITENLKSQVQSLTAGLVPT